MSDVSIERITYIDEEVMKAAKSLSLQLDSSNQVTITEEYLETVILNPDSFWLMAKRNARFVGMASLFIMRMPTNVRSFLENVVVDEDSRGKGIGFALCSEAFAIADSQGANTLRTQAGTHNAASKAMLQKAGFKIENYLDYYEVTGLL